MDTPHYLRFARALALATTIGGAAGCGSAGPVPSADAGVTVADAGPAPAVDAGETVADAGETVADAGETVADAGETVADAGETVPLPQPRDAGTLSCDECECVTAQGSSKPNCYDHGASDCCVAVGPLPPPELLS